MASNNNNNIDVSVNIERGQDKRPYSSPLEAELAKKPNVSSSQTSDGSFTEFMNDLPPIESGLHNQPQQPQPVLANQFSQLQAAPASPSIAQAQTPYQTVVSSSIRHPYQQSAPYQYATPGFTGTPPYQPMPRIPLVHQSPAGMMSDTRPQLPGYQTQHQYPSPSHQPVQLSGSLNPENFAILLATALQTPQVKQSMGSIIQDKLEAMTEDYERRLRALESQNLELQVENRSLNQRLDVAECAIEELEQYGRRNALRISNEWLETEGESTDTLILNMANDVLGVDLQATDISRSHRVGPKIGSRPRPILVKFSTYRARERVFRARKTLKNSRNRTFINEDLTKKRGALAFHARQMKKTKQIQDTWTYDCRVFIKNNDGSTRVVMNDFELKHQTQTFQLERP